MSTGSWSNVSALLNADFGIATDVTFQFPGETGGTPSQVKAHRLVLGFISPVFRNQFFGTVQDKDEIIAVEGTTKEAFERMVKFIYGENIEWKNMCMREIFDVVNMAEKYMIPDLLEASKTAIKSFALTDDNLIENAAIAEEFDHFEDASHILSRSCRDFLRNKLKTLQDAAKFMDKHASTEFEGVAVKMLASLKTPGPPACSNCGIFPCRDGMAVVDFASLFVGCVLRTTGEEQDYWGENYFDKVCKVLNILDDETIAMNVVGSVHAYKAADGESFRYACSWTSA